MAASTAAQAYEFSKLEKLPTELLLVVLDFCEVKERYMLRQVSKRIEAVVTTILDPVLNLGGRTLPPLSSHMYKSGQQPTRVLSNSDKFHQILTGSMEMKWQSIFLQRISRVVMKCGFELSYPVDAAIWAPNDPAGETHCESEKLKEVFLQLREAEVKSNGPVYSVYHLTTMFRAMPNLHTLDFRCHYDFILENMSEVTWAYLRSLTLKLDIFMEIPLLFITKNKPCLENLSLIGGRLWTDRLWTDAKYYRGLWQTVSANSKLKTLEMQGSLCAFQPGDFDLLKAIVMDQDRRVECSGKVEKITESDGISLDYGFLKWTCT